MIGVAMVAGPPVSGPEPRFDGNLGNLGVLRCQFQRRAGSFQRPRHRTRRRHPRRPQCLRFSGNDMSKIGSLPPDMINRPARRPSSGAAQRDVVVRPDEGPTSTLQFEACVGSSTDPVLTSSAWRLPALALSGAGT